MLHLKNQLIIAILGTILLLIISLLESAAGFKWDYHADARTYIESVHDWHSILTKEPRYLVNNLFYFYVDLMGKNKEIIIFNNYLAFLVTNYLLMNAARYWSMSKQFQILFLLLFLFNPYRLHLANFVLKDTLIAMFVCIVFYYNAIFNKISYFGILGSFLLRYASIIYYSLIFITSVKKLIFLSILILIILLGSGLYGMIETIIEISSGDMRIRSFDTTPTFSSFGIFGGLLRALIWPFWLITGSFVIFNQSLPILMVAVSSLVSTLYWSYMGTFKRYIYSVYMPLAFIAFIVPGFVAFQRYAFPIVLFAGLSMLKKEIEKNK